MVVVTRTPEYLEHHGIQGQKWGKRNGPPYPLDYGDHTAVQKKENPKSVINNYENHNEKSSSSDSGNTSKKSESSEKKEKVKTVERSVSTGSASDTSEKTDSKVSSKETETSKTDKRKISEKEEQEEKERQSLHDRRKEAWMKKGLTEEQAEQQINLENRAIAIAAVTAVAIGASVTYGLVRQHNIDSDFVLKGGTDMFRVSTSGEASVQDMFYATTNKADSRKYAGMYAKQLNGQLFGEANGKDVYQKILSPKSDINVAGAKTGERIFNELKKDSSFLAALGVKAPNRVGYDEFNRVSIMSDKNTGAVKMFFDKLKEEGYGGVIDINDAKYSGYEANRPVILFNQQSNVDISSVKKLTQQTINKNFNFAKNMIQAQDFLNDSTHEMKKVALMTGTAGLVSTGGKYVNNLGIENIEMVEVNDKQRKQGKQGK